MMFKIKSRGLSILLLLSVAVLIQAQENNQISDEAFSYFVNGHIPVHRFNGKFDKPGGKVYILGKFRYNLVGKYQDRKPDPPVEYVLLQLASFKYHAVAAPPDSTSHTNSNYLVPQQKFEKKKRYKPYFVKKTPNLIDVEDQDSVFVIEKTKFQYQLDEGFIRKRYEIHKFHPAWGASLTVPFKIRPSVNDLNMKITPELSLGGFVGYRKRINRYKSQYWYLPVITAGVTIIGINSDNTIVEQDVSGVSDGLVFARTVSIGTIVQFDNFQMGFVFGWDKPGGEIAKDWIYNDRMWYSFTIGFDFIKKNEDE